MSAPRTLGTDFRDRYRHIKILSAGNTMFSSPPTKRIRRSEVFDEHDEDSASSSSSDEEVTETTTIQEIQDSVGLAYHFDYDLIENEGGKITKFAHLQVDEAEAESEIAPVRKVSSEDNAFEFRLFSTRQPPNTAADDDTKGTQKTTRAKPASTRINIRSPTPDEPSSGRFLNPHRPQSYYFTSSTAPPSFASTAISGLSILNSSHSPWPGAAMPWRVIHLPPPPGTRKRKPSHLPPTSPALPLRSTSTSTAPRRKPSKKRRIQLRTLSRLVDAKAKEKEDHLREKKTRLNRERKVKRREKEKAEKERVKASMMVEGVGVEA